jgi:hypothetical protein
MSDEAEEKSTASLARRSRALYGDFYRTVFDTMALAICSMDGLLLVSSRPTQLEAIRDGFPVMKGVDDSTLGLKEAREKAEFVQRELDFRFPTLISQTIIALWGHLEAFAEDLATLVVEAEPSILENEKNSRIKVSLGDFAAPEEERSALIVKALQREVGSPPGVNVFENLFERLGVGGNTERDVKDWLFELQQVRNVLVHRQGKADRHFLRNCPRFGASAGERLQCSTPLMTLYSFAVVLYGATVARRLADKYPPSSDDQAEPLGPSTALDDACRETFDGLKAKVLAMRSIS